MVTKTKEGRGANGGAGRSVTESAAAQAAPATRKKAAGGAAAGEAKGGARGGKSAASQNESDASPREDDATADTARDLPGSSAATMSSKKLLTEAEILKMGDKDYMNEAQLAFFKNRQQQMLNADVFIAELFGFIIGTDQDLIHPSAGDNPSGSPVEGREFSQFFRNPMFQVSGVLSHLPQKIARQSMLLIQHRLQKMQGG